MEVISSRATFLQKRGIPLVWFGFLALVAGPMLWDTLRGAGDASAQDFFLLGLLAFIGVGMMSASVFDVADEVLDGGDFLLIRKGGQEERVDLADIVTVSDARFVNPRRLTLRLARPGKLGQGISFIPARELPGMLNPFGKSAVAEKLKNRVDAARAKRARKVGP